MKILFVFLAFLPHFTAAALDSHLSCMQEAVDVCKDADFKLAPVGKDEFSKMFETRRLHFIDWIRPVALFVQGATGMPASVVIAQAGVSSDWGGGPAFRNNNNIFRQMCWTPNTLITGEFMMAGRKYTYKGTCGTEKIFGNVGRPYKFASYEDSVLAYLHMLIFSPSRHYKNLQDELKRGVKSTPPRQAGFRPILSMMNAFTHDTKFAGNVQTSIQQEKLASYDVPACWSCLLVQQTAATAAAAPAPTPAAGAPVVQPAPVAAPTPPGAKSTPPVEAPKK